MKIQKRENQIKLYDFRWNQHFLKFVNKPPGYKTLDYTLNFEIDKFMITISLN